MTTPTGRSRSSTRCATRSLAASSSAPISAAATSPGAAARVSRRASCGAASATNAIGPVDAVATAVSATATTISASRERSTRTPSARAASSPISSIVSRRESASAAGTSSASAAATGHTCSQPRPLRLPTQPVRRRERVVARRARDQVGVDRLERGADADADQHQPVALHAAAQREQVDDDRRSTVPARDGAEADLQRGAAATSRITTSAPVAAPVVKPMTSGLPSGLRVMLWKIAPAIPNAAPTSSAVSTRGSAQRLDDERARRVAAAEQRRDHLAGRERVVAGADADDADRERGEQQRAAHERGAPVHAQRDAVARVRTPCQASALTAARSASGARAR